MMAFEKGQAMNFSDLRARDKKLNEVAFRIEAVAPDTLEGMACC
jgi:hypothetical protein